MFLADLVDLVLPAACAGCEQPSAGPLCGPCRAAFRATVPQRTRPDPEPAGLPPTYALGAYAGSLRRALLQYKEERRHELTGVLGEALAAVVMRSLSSGRGPRGPVVLVPVPATAAAARRRYGDHILRLAKAAAKVLPGAAVAVPLRALPKAGDSAELTAAERAAAAGSAFAVRRGEAARLREAVGSAAGQGAVGAADGRAGAVRKAAVRSFAKRATTVRSVSGRPTVVLVDDIVTTGVTLVAAVANLREAGIPVERTAVLAATQRRR
ncbi:ComF family protein [Dactylosporangium roseum]|uniref:ComF family protein n=1 Tax=Dactylosporangium roseum TaxID=47989 RepID=A0ABY5Z1F5_9ACTN|nr:phosphoribosyltransferase family protein [Dactylosporangium roseum]UWZ35845.1 ComF family protein [Dactylosporangium roseum]